MSPSEKSLEDIQDEWSQWMWLMELQHGANFSSVGSPLSSVRLFGRPQWLTEVRLFAKTPCLSYWFAQMGNIKEASEQHLLLK